MKYLIWCRRHESMYGKAFALFWGQRDSKGDYSSDVRTAHRFTEDEIKDFTTNDDIPIPIDFLGLSEEYAPEEEFNEATAMLAQKCYLRGFLKGGAKRP